jgi:ribosomal protein S18 acetylase RimI-like enzyme
MLTSFIAATTSSFLLFLQSATANGPQPPCFFFFACFCCCCCGWQFRSATPDDVALARKTMMQQAMNPLSISKEHLLVAFDEDADAKDTAAGSIPRLLGFGQIRPLDNNNNNNNNNSSYSELASLYVLPNQRGQGIGGALIQELLSRHDNAKQPNTRKGDDDDDDARVVVLLTLRPTMPLYEKYGFAIVNSNQMSELPRSLQLEYQAGCIVSTFLGNDLVCMKRQRPAQEEKSIDSS